MRRRDRLRVTGVAGAALLIGALLLSCSRDASVPTGPHDPASAAVATVTVLGAPADGLLLVGQSRPLSVDVRDAAGVALQGRSVVWSTSNAMVATASSLGVVTATATGVVTITAVVEGHSGAADFTARFAIGTPSAGASQAMTTSILSGSVSVTVPPNAIAAGSVLFVAPADAAGLPAGNQLVPNTAFAFGPDGTQFATPISLSLKVDTSSLASWERAGLAIYLLKNGAWEEVPGSTASGDHVEAPVLHFSTYAVLRRLPPTTMSIVAGNGQTAMVGTAVSVRPSVKLLDASGRGVSHVPVQFAVTGGGGSVTGGSQLTDESGTATVGGWTLGPNVGTNSLTATSIGLPNLTVVATATAPSPVGMSIYGGDAQSARIGTLLPMRPAVTVTDARGNGVAGVQVEFAVTGGGGTLAGASQVTDADGLARVGGWTLGPAAGPNSIAATSAGLPSVTFTATATVAGPPPLGIRIVSQPDLVQNGITFPSPIVVDLVDSMDVRVQSASLPVTLSMLTGNGTLAGTMTVVAVAGRATFADVRMTGPSEDNWILVSAPGLYTNAVRVTITPAGLTRHLSIRAPLQGVAAFAPYPEWPVVEIVDASGRRVAGATNTVFVSDFGNPASLLGTKAVQAVDGVATFADLATDGAGIHRLYFTADDQNIAPALSDFFHVATNVSMVTRPSSPTRSGALLSPQPVVMLSDFSNYAPLLTPSPGNTAYVTATAVPGPISPPYPGTRPGTLSGTTTVRAVNGIATFTDLRVSGLGPVRIIYSVSPRLFDAFTDLFVSPAVAQVPAQIAILAQPTTATSGLNADYFMIEVRDATGAPIFGDVHPVTVAIASGNGTLTGTTTETTYQYGYTYFRDFAIAGSGPHTLVFSTGAASVKTAPITVTHVPRSLVITTQPAGTASGVVLPTQPVVKILDDAGLTVVGASTPVTVRVANNVPVTLSGPTTVNAVNGVATFSGLKVAGGRDFVLEFTDPNGLGAQSQTLRLSQVAARLRVVTQPSQAISGFSLNPPAVEVLDADGERVAYTSNTVTATLNSGPGISLIGATSVAPVFGLASFSMFLTGAGAFTFDFAYPGVPGVSSNSTVLTQLVNQAVFGTLPAGAVDGVPFTTQPTAEVRDHANLLYAVNTGTATVSVISGPGTLGGTTTVNIVNGIARFTDLKLSGKGVYVLGVATSLPTYSPPGPLTRVTITVP